MIYESHEQMSCDLAEDELDRIISLKEDVVGLFDKMRRLSFSLAVSELEGAFEQEFDDVFYQDWHRLNRISGSIAYTAEIPSLDTLRAKKASAKQNISAASALMPLPNLAARGMPRPSTLVRLSEEAV